MEIEYKPSPGTNMPQGPRHISTLKQLYEVPYQRSRRNSYPDEVQFYPLQPANYSRPVPYCAQSHISFYPQVDSYRKKRDELDTFYKEEMRLGYRKNLYNFYQRGYEWQLAVDKISPDDRMKQYARYYDKSLDEAKEQQLEFPQQRQSDTFYSHKDAYMPFDAKFGALGHPHYNHRQNNIDKSGIKFFD